MAALKKSGEEDWKRKIPRLKSNNAEDKKGVLDTIVVTLEENNRNNNSTVAAINSNGDGLLTGKYILAPMHLRTGPMEIPQGPK